MASNSNEIPVSMLTPAAPATARPQLVLEPTRGWRSLQLQRLWHYRELLYFLVWRDVKVRYKQTLLGVIWIVLQPVVSMIIFTIIFGLLLRVPSNGAPYPIFAFAALLPWQYFANSLTRSATSLVDNSQLLTKIYFPRLILPIAGVLSGLADLGVAFLVLIGLMFIYGIPPTTGIVLLPILVLLAMLTALGFGLWLSALNVRYRDIKHIIPFIVQIWMYATPVIYSSTIIPERFRFLLALNPMTAVVEGFRWTLLGNVLVNVQPPGLLSVFASLITLVVLMSGIVFFRTTERTFADIV